MTPSVKPHRADDERSCQPQQQHKDRRALNPRCPILQTVRIQGGHDAALFHFMHELWKEVIAQLLRAAAQPMGDEVSDSKRQ